MLSTTYSAAILGIDGRPIIVECSVSRGINNYEIVGLPDNAVKESKDRITSAIYNSGYTFPFGNILVNLAPADVKKTGSAYDLAILAGILCGGGTIKADLSDKGFIGEVSLSGEVRRVKGALCMCMALAEAGVSKVYVPVGNAAEASAIEGVEIYPISTVGQLVKVLNGEIQIEPVRFDRESFEKARKSASFKWDFSEVKGQERVKRAIEIAAAGGHNILMIGAPGAGKSMLAKRIPTILPEMTFRESVETTKIHSISGLLGSDQSLMTERPFRAPHHTISPVALSGGGSNPAPGEVSLSHNGVLFLDELPEFGNSVTEILRQPLEDRQITISRAMGRYTFPCSFMLVCAMNPCKCGYYGHPTKKCTCKSEDIKRYLKRISGPLLDRIDIQIEVPSLTYDEISDTAPGEPSSAIRERVNRVRKIAETRFADSGGVNCNGEMGAAEVQKYCKLDQTAAALMKSAFESMGLSARGYDRILKVARTIADLDGSDIIKAAHAAEAIQLRTLDKKYL